MRTGDSSLLFLCEIEIENGCSYYFPLLFYPAVVRNWPDSLRVITFVLYLHFSHVNFSFGVVIATYYTFWNSYLLA